MWLKMWLKSSIQNSLGLPNRLSISALLMAGVLTLGVGCNSSDTTPKATTEGTDSPAEDAGITESVEPIDEAQVQIVSDFAAQVVIPTYKELVSRSTVLKSTVETFVGDANGETLKAAQDAWVTARSPWEQSEAFAFGPADALGYDGALDDWPVNETDVEAILASEDELTVEYIQDRETTEQGFHTIELLLFGLDAQKTAADFTERELAYLSAATGAFDQAANDLLISWTEGIDGNPAYQEVLATAGNEDNPAYISTQAGIQEIVEGMIGCLEEVGEEKIGAPLESKENLDFESRFSQTSLSDFKNNIISARNAYVGEVPDVGTSGESLSAYVATLDAEVDEKVKSDLDAALAAVEAIPGPIEQTITDSDAEAKIKTAMAAVLTAYETVEYTLLPLVQDS